MKNRIITSFYSDNVDPKLVEMQKAVVDKFLSKNTSFSQAPSYPTHARNINIMLDKIDSVFDVEDFTFLILDIDAIPMQSGVLDYIFERAEAGSVIGIAQRSNHIENHQHIFCGAPCVAMTRSTWRKIGKPLADPTIRGDVAEEFTWRAQETGVPVEFIYPTHFKAPPIRMAWEKDTRPYWPLEEFRADHHYGRGTFYSVPGFEGDAFYHQYQSFFPGSSEMFVETASEVLK